MTRRLRGLLPLLGILACSTDNDAPTAVSSGEKLKSLANLSAPEGPVIITNKDDYIPGEMVVMVGSGFEPGEFVSLTLTETPELHDDRVFMVTADSVGGFWFDEFRPELHHIGVSFVLAALGETSGRQAQTTFTDAITVSDVSKNHNGDPGASELSMARPNAALGDLLIAQVTLEGFGTSDVICTPTGWTTSTDFRTNNSSSVSQQFFYKVVDVGDTPTTTYIWQFRSTSGSCGGTSNQVTGKGAVGGIIAYSGVDHTHANGPIFAWAGTTGSSTTQSAPTLLNGPSVAGSPDPIPAGYRVIRYFGNDKEFQIASSGTGTSERYFTRRAKSGGGFEKPSGQAADGDQVATGNATAVTGSNGGNGGNWVAQTVALRAAPVVLPNLTINDVSAAEGTAVATTPFTFTVTLSAASAQTVTATWATANGTTSPATGGVDCLNGNDYITNGGTVTFNPGVTVQQVTVDVCADDRDEVDETFFVNLSNPSASATISDNQGLGTIQDDDTAPTVSIDDVTLAEGNAGTTSFTFTVSPSAVSGQDISVNYSTADGTTNPATGGASCASADYQSVANGSLTIPAGQASGTVTINVCGDLVNEANETFFVNLATPTNATISDGQGVGTITNDDAAPTLAIDDKSVTEGNAGTTTAQFTVTLTGATSQTVTVDYATANGTTNPATGSGSCAAGVDYVSGNGSLSFAPGETSKTIDVSVCGDLLDEANETYFVNLANGSNATVTDDQGLGTINDDDAAPTLSINDVTANEGNAGTTDFDFTVTLSAASGQTVTVNFATADGTANPATGGAACGAGVDYENANGTLTFTAGQTSKTVTVTVCGDLVHEANETFFVDLSNQSNAGVTDAQGLGTITNDDAAPPSDNQGPITSNVLVNPIPMGQPGTVTANVNDATTGNSRIGSAEFSIDGGGWNAMTAQDGGFDEVSEDVTGSLAASSSTGVFQVCVRGYDEHGNLGNTECFLYAVYDPSAGFVTGGGWINSPAYAYPADPTLTGRATFGFVSKYKRGATTPEGSTEFQFQVANLNFHSTSYQWLVVSGTRAQFKGVGRLNGADGYNFLVTAVDGGKNFPDAFRIRITLNGTVVYDNQPGQGESTDAATALGGGSIVIHSK